MSHGDGAGGQGDAGRKWQSPPGAGAQGRTVGVEKVVSWAEETRRYRRSPAGWWWLALFGVPLLFAVIGLAFADPDDSTASAKPTSSATGSSTSSGSTSSGSTPSGSTSSGSTSAGNEGPVGVLASDPFAVRRVGNGAFLSATVPDDAPKTALVAGVQAALDPVQVDATGVVVTPGTKGPEVTKLAGVLTAFKDTGDFGVAYDLKKLTYYGVAASDAVKAGAASAVGSAWAGVPTAGDGLVVGGNACAQLQSQIKVLLAGTMVTFVTNGMTLNRESSKVLTDIAQLVKACPDASLAIVGHTDNTGSNVTNERVSTLRAEAVKTFLVAAGVPAASLTTAGKGETEPLLPNDTAAHRALNRRFEITVK